MNLNPDENTLASNEIESIDRVIAFRYFCVCGDDRNDHETREIDSEFNTPSIQMIEILGCRKCSCQEYIELRKEAIDYTQEANDNIFGKERKQFYVFCQKCDDMFKVDYLTPCPKLVIGCEKFKICPHCEQHLDDPPYVADTQSELRQILQNEIK